MKKKKEEDDQILNCLFKQISLFIKFQNFKIIMTLLIA